MSLSVCPHDLYELDAYLNILQYTISLLSTKIVYFITPKAFYMTYINAQFGCF